MIGKSVPDFTASSSKGDLALDNYKGRYLVIYFYPKDNTPGCTLEAKDFRDLYSEFTAHNAEIMGVSRDSIASHSKFECKYDLPFPLISDSGSELCNLFGVINNKSIFGKTALGLVRSTFLINPEGTLIHEWRNVKAKEHAQEVLDTLRASRS